MRGIVDGRVRRPSLLVVSESCNASSIQDLFARRGFAVVVAPSLTALERFLAQTDCLPEAALVDFSHDDAACALEMLESCEPTPVLVAILPEQEALLSLPAVDACFVPPVDRARLFVRVLELVAARNGWRKRELASLPIEALGATPPLGDIVAHAGVARTRYGAAVPGTVPRNR